jgi:WD40 repeat protein
LPAASRIGYLDAVGGVETTVPAPGPPPDEDSDGVLVVPGPGLPTVPRADYELEGEVGRGGTGRVLRARDRVLDRPVALKEMLPGREHAASRFLLEAKITAKLQHPGIVPVYSAGRWPGGEPFYAMKLVTGQPLDQVIKSAAGLAERLALLPNVLAVAEAIAYAHGERVIHRDLKPANILLGAFGETIVIDWGLIQHLDQDRERPPLSDSTRRTVVGTPAYMPPEQAAGDPLDERADVYAIGAVLYHVLAGTPPYRADTADQILREVLTAPPRPLAEHEGELQPELIAIVDKAMARRREDRYPSAKALADDLRRFQTGQLVGAHSYSLLALIVRRIRRNLPLFILGTLLAMVLAVGGAISVYRIGEERDRANHLRELADVARAEAEQMREDEVDRSDQLVLLESRHVLDHDPTASLAWVKRLSRDSRQWSAARIVAGEARDRGAASLFLGHSGRITSVAYAPDGVRFASWADDRTLRIWSARAGTPPRVIADLGSSADRFLGGVAFSHDGKSLIARLGGRITIFDAGSGARLFESAASDGGQDSAAYRAASPDAAWLAEGSARGLVLSARAGGAPKKLLGATSGEPAQPFFSNDGRRLAAVVDRSLWVWDLASGKEHLVATAPSDLHQALFSPDGRWLAWSNRRSPEIELYGFGTERRRTLHGHSDPPRTMALSPDGRRLASAGSFDSKVRLWDLESGAPPEVLPGRDPTLLVFSPSGRELAMVVEHEGRWNVELLELEAGRVRTLAGHDEQIQALAFAPDGRYLLTAAGKSLRRWDLSATSARRLVGRGPEVPAAAVGPSATLVVVAAGAPSLMIHEPWGGRSRRIELESPVRQAAIAPDGKTAITASRPPWRLELDSGRSSVPTAGLTEAAVVRVAFAKDGAALFALAEGGVRRLAPSGMLETLCSSMRPGHEPRFSAGGRWLAGDPAAGRAAPVELCDLAERRTLTLAADGARPISLLAFSDNELRIATAARERLELRDPKNGSVSLEVGVEDEPISAIALSPDARWLASAAGKTLRIWDLETRQRETLRGHTDVIVGLAFSPDGETLASASQDQTLRIWDRWSGDSRVVSEGREIAALSYDALGTLIAVEVGGDVSLWRDDAPLDGPGLRRWLDALTNARLQPDGMLIAN